MTRDIAGRRKGRTMREKGETFRHQEWRVKKKKNQCSIFLLYLVSFSLHGPSPQGKAGKSTMQWRRVGKGKRKKWLTSPQIVNTWQATTHLILWQKVFGQRQILTVCEIVWSVDSNMCLRFLGAGLHVLNSSHVDLLSFLFCFEAFC